MEKFRENGRKYRIFRGGKSYWQQVIRSRERLGMLIKTLGILAVIAWVYYRSFWAMCVLFPIGVFYYRTLLEECVRRKKQEFMLEFKEMMQIFSSFLNIGYSVENALKECLKELRLIYEKDSMIIHELEIMVRQLRVQIPAEQAVDEFAQRIGLADVENFAEVFVMAKRSGGDMISIIRNTVNQIGDKIDVKREIDTLLSARKYEFRVMSVIPFGMILYMSISFPEFLGFLYGNLVGIGVMTGCLAIYLGAYWFGLKIIEIEV